MTFVYLRAALAGAEPTPSPTSSAAAQGSDDFAVGVPVVATGTWGLGEADCMSLSM